MRLTCPNCGAEYDVPEGLIPPAGKHVQCTACHTRWFRRGEAREDLSEDEILRKLETRAARPGPRLVPPGGVEGATAFGASDRMASEAEDPDDDVEDWTEEAPAEPRPEEEPREVAAAPAPAEPRAGVAPVSAPVAFPLTPDRPRVPRNTESAPAPSRPGGSSTPEPTKPGAPPTAPRAAAPETGPAPSSTPAAPEISPPAPSSASVEAGQAPRTDPRPELREAPRHTPRIELSEGEPSVSPPPRRRRFLPGFLLALLLAGLAFEIYIWRAPLAEQVPAAAPAIRGYADAVDTAREWLGTRFGRPSEAPPAP
jgi:predicted Zn finger-like uncharacterized protein